MSQVLPPISAVTKVFESFARYCQNSWDGLAHGALKVSALHFRPVDYFKSYIFRFSIKYVKILCIAHLCRTIFNLIRFQVGNVCFVKIHRRDEILTEAVPLTDVVLLLLTLIEHLCHIFGRNRTTQTKKKAYIRLLQQKSIHMYSM